MTLEAPLVSRLPRGRGTGLTLRLLGRSDWTHGVRGSESGAHLPKEMTLAVCRDFIVKVFITVLFIIQIR